LIGATLKLDVVPNLPSSQEFEKMKALFHLLISHFKDHDAKKLSLNTNIAF